MIDGVVIKKYFIYLFLFLTTTSLAVPLQWQKLAPGLEYSRVSTFAGFYDKGIQVFRIDLNYYHLQLAFTKQRDKIITIADLMNANHAVIAANGGFFSPDLKPLGLRIVEGQVKNPMKNTNWWGVFYTQGTQATIVSPKQFMANKNINFAVQSGPRLIVNGQIPSLKYGIANRTALGITRDNKVVLLVTNRFPLSTMELAQIMRAPASEGGLDCVNALNLDGGSSTQLYAKVGGFSLSVPSLAMVTDAVLVVPKK